MVKKTDKVKGGKEQAQHVDMYRKVLLRKQLLSLVTPGAAYIPFIGDGDIAAELYGKFTIYGADIDPQRVTVAKSRLPEANIIAADCDKWPFPGVDAAFSLADFDAYSEPYASFRAFWQCASKTSSMALFFTDGHRPDGTKVKLLGVNEKRMVFNAYFGRHIKPWFIEYIEPWRAIKFSFYLRGHMLYWGAVVRNA